jgi:hypothetical protein
MSVVKCQKLLLETTWKRNAFCSGLMRKVGFWMGAILLHETKEATKN